MAFSVLQAAQKHTRAGLRLERGCLLRQQITPAYDIPDVADVELRKNDRHVAVGSQISQSGIDRVPEMDLLRSARQRRNDHPMKCLDRRGGGRDVEGRPGTAVGRQDSVWRKLG